jgi:DNA invertase Pin-like site-specific DNA recombinase
MTPTKASSGAQLGYARVSTGHQSLDQQLDALHAAGVDPERVYRDKLSGTSTREQRPGLAALLDYARPGDAIVVVGIDRLGRNAAEVMTTIRELRDREIVLRSLREGIDTSNATGRMVAGVLASLAELELELGRERRAAAREARRARGQAIGRPKALDKSKAGLARRMHTSGEPVSTIAATLGVSRATVYRVLGEQDDDGRATAGPRRKSAENPYSTK